MEKKINVTNLSLKGNRGELVIGGDLRNNNLLKLDKVIVKVILFDDEQKKQGASLVAVENLEANSSKKFSILHEL